MMRFPENTVEIGEPTRRKFMQMVGAGGSSIAALSAAVETVQGTSRDGYPIIYKRDLNGNPTKIRYVSKERFNVIQVLENITPEHISSKPDSITGITLGETQTKGSAPPIKVYVDKMNEKVIRSMKNRVRDIPLKFEERPEADITLQANCRTGDVADTMEGNIQIGSSNSAGTLSTVGTDSDYTVLITSWHVMREGTNDYMYQPAPNHSESRTVGVYLDHSPLSSTGYDICKFASYENDHDIGGTKSSQQPDISDAWTFAGLSDYLSRISETLSCSFAGAQTCYTDSLECTDVAKYAELKHAAYTKPDITIDGDSGGPFVDDNGSLVCILTGSADNLVAGVGPVGSEALGSIGVGL